MKQALINLSVLLIVVSLSSGCSIIMHPLSLMFGGPSKAKQSEIHDNFSRLQADYRTSRHVFIPTYVREGRGRRWDTHVAEMVMRQSEEMCGIKGICDTASPGVPFGLLGRNQFAYLWDQADVYANWVRTAGIPGDYIWFTEIFVSDSLQAYAIHTFVINGSGGIAYARLLNNHQFKDETPRSFQESAAFLMKKFRESIDRPPDKDT